MTNLLFHCNKKTYLKIFSICYSYNRNLPKYFQEISTFIIAPYSYYKELLKKGAESQSYILNAFSYEENFIEEIPTQDNDILNVGVTNKSYTIEKIMSTVYKTSI